MKRGMVQHRWSVRGECFEYAFSWFLKIALLFYYRGGARDVRGRLRIQHQHEWYEQRAEERLW